MTTCCVCAYPAPSPGILCGTHMHSLPERLTTALIDTWGKPDAHAAVVAECAEHSEAARLRRAARNRRVRATH